MKVKNFEKHIRHLTQEEIQMGTINALNRVLVAKGIVTKGELQGAFLAWMAARPESRKRSTKKCRTKRSTSEAGATGAY